MDEVYHPETGKEDTRELLPLHIIWTPMQTRRRDEKPTITTTPVFPTPLRIRIEE